MVMSISFIQPLNNLNLALFNNCKIYAKMILIPNKEMATPFLYLKTLTGFGF
jgi:hypothetical protein